MAVRLLLAPVVAAGVAVPAVAQSSSQPQRSNSAQIAPRNADPKELLHQGREALKAGQLDRAQDLAKQADATNASGRWGLFDDTPESLEKDIAAARMKLGKAEAERLMKAAKDLYGKPTKTAGERIANLDQAYNLADQAQAKAGPSDFFDDLFGSNDRPEKLKKEIDAARTALRKANPGVVSTAKAVTKPTTNSGIQQTGAMVKASDGPPVPSIPVASSTNTHSDAARLVAEGRALLKTGKLVEAKGKAAEALKLNATFSNTEDSPTGLSRDVMTEGKAQVDFLVRDAETRVVNKEFAKAEESLTKASQIASGLGFQTRPIEEQKATVKRIASGDTTVTASNLVVPVVTAPAVTTPNVAAPQVPEALTPIAIPTPTPTTTTTVQASPAINVPAINTPALPGVVLPTPAAPTPTAPAVASGVTAPMITPAVPGAPTTLPGSELLKQARTALKSNDLETARKLAAKARNEGDTPKADADALLREIDAEMGRKKVAETAATFDNATRQFQTKQYESAMAVFKVIDVEMLSADQKKQYQSMYNLCEVEMAKVKASSAVVTPVQSVSNDPTAPKPVIPGTLPTGQTPNSTGLTDQVKALGEVEFQRLRSEGLEAEAKARDLYNKGETDVAIQMLNDYTNKVKSSTLSTNRQSMLLTSVSRRLESFQIMKRQMDFYKSEASAKIENRSKIVGKQLAQAQQQDEIKKKVGEINDLMKKKSYRQAEELALQVKSMDPDDPTLTAVYEMAKRQRRVDDYAKLKSEKEQFTLDVLNDAERSGPAMKDGQPLHVDPERAMIARLRGTGSDLYFKTLSPAEREIEVKLERPMTVDLPQGTTLREAINQIRTKAGVNITTDDAAIGGEQISLDNTMVNESLKDLSLRNVLTVLLDKASLKYVVENDVIRVTTEKKARGKLYTKVFSVMELVTPIPDFALAPHQSVAKALAGQSNPNPAWESQVNGTKAFNPNAALGGGELRSSQMPGFNGAPNAMGGSALLQNDNKNNPLASSATLANSGRTNHSAQLMRLITGMVKPYSWSDAGGAGKLDYYDIGGALVVNQTADVIREVQDLLEALRKLQEVSVSVEIRVISLSESFFERIGVDFAMNIKTKDHSAFEQSLTTGQFAPEPFINSINAKNVTVGWNPTANGFTPDLGVPIRTNSYGLGVPAFGGYPGPGNGGLGLGLAFLNDIQVFMFMEAASGDRRVNIMQAPKITLFNGQTSTVFVSDFAFFTTGLDVINVGGQVVYIPRNVPIPVGNSPAPPGVQTGGGTPGVTVTVQAIVSADRRFVRLNLAPTLTSLTSATVPLFPVTAFITPVFEGGSQGVPIPFTQFFQQPSISEINVQTTVAIPDGGTVVLGGLKTLAEGRNEFGPPVLSQIPYVSRLFRNQGTGRETRHIMIMVTPRIIIQSEEEFNQTGSAPGMTAPPQ